MAARKSHARGTEGIQVRGKGSRTWEGKGQRRYNGDHSLDADWSSQVCGKMAGWLAVATAAAAATASASASAFLYSRRLPF